MGWIALLAAVYGAWWLARRLRGTPPTPEERAQDAALGRGIRSASSVILGPLGGAGAPEFVGPPPVDFEPEGPGVLRLDPDESRAGRTDG